MIFLKLFLTFAKIGLFTFGGGYAMIPLIEKETVDIQKWFGHKEFVDIITIAESTPGPIAVNAATFVGHRVAGFAGAMVSTLGVVLPAFIVILLVVKFFYAFKASPKIEAVLKGLRPAIIALIAAALYSLIQKKTILLISKQV